MMFDLLLKGGRVIDPSQNIDGKFDIAFSMGKVAALLPEISKYSAKITHDVSGHIVCPGLIDMHSHVYWGGTSCGVDAEPIARRSGTTTFVDAGSAGAGNFVGFREHVIKRSAPRILSFINIAFPGIFAFSKTVMVGEASDVRLIEPRDCLRVAEENPDYIVGVKARIGARAGGAMGTGPLYTAIEVADELDIPVMAHLDTPPPSRKEVLDAMRPGDVLTHCFRAFPNSPVRRDNSVRKEIIEAHERGIVFDIGHGAGGFAFHTAKAMLAEGIFPDVISSDVHALCVDGPAHDVLAVMSKFIALGMPLTEVIKATTINPAKTIKRPELGSLAVGGIGDAAILQMVNEPYQHLDCIGATLNTDSRLECKGTIIAGQLWSSHLSK